MVEKLIKSRSLGVSKFSNSGIAVGIAGVVIAMMIPLPTLLIDVLLGFNLSFSLLILLLIIYTKKHPDFSIFPYALLFGTLFRLSLNVATTRRILLTADAGRVIDGFGGVFVGVNYFAGAAVFVIFTVVLIMVIWKGSAGIAEAGSEYSLDVMPLKERGIEANLKGGLIGEDVAREKRDEIKRETDFYGWMEGVGRFMRIEVIAAVVISLVNIVGGLVAGIYYMGMGGAQALRRYTQLTIGDGVVVQIPCFVFMTAAGILILRVGAFGGDAGEDEVERLSRKPLAILAAVVVLFCFGLLFRSVLLLFIFLSAMVGSLGYFANLVMRTVDEKGFGEENKAGLREPESVEQLLHVDPIELEIGYGLIPLVEESEGGNLLHRLGVMRRRFVSEMGLIVPPIKIRDNLELKPSEYVLKVSGIEVSRSELIVDRYLAMKEGDSTEKVEGIETIEPCSGRPAVWITEAETERGEALGYEIVDASSVLATHISETIRNYAYELLSRENVQTLLDNIRKKYPILVEELVPDVLSVGEVKRVLQNLLREKISIRNIATVLETLLDYSPTTKDIGLLTERVRYSLARYITKQYADQDGSIKAIVVDPRLDRALSSRLHKTEEGSSFVLEPDISERIFEKLSKEIEKALSVTKQPIVICSPTIRLALKRLVERNFPDLVVLSYNDITTNVKINSVGYLSFKDKVIKREYANRGRRCSSRKAG